MRAILQRVTNANVVIEGKEVGKINDGFMILVGFCNEDNQNIIDKMIEKIIHLRVFEDENEKLNLSLLDIKGSILSISQFTLYANCKRGRRPSFLDAAKPDMSSPLYDYFNEQLRKNNIEVATGKFGAMMDVSLTNNGPTTIILDSNDIF